MSDVIKYSDIAEKGLFDPAIEGAIRLIKELDRIESAMKETLKQSQEIAKNDPFASWKSFTEASKAVEMGIVAGKELLKVDETRKNLLKELTKLEAAYTKQVEAETEQVRRLTAAKRVLMKEQKSANDKTKEAADAQKALNATLNESQKALADAKTQIAGVAKAQAAASKQVSEEEKLRAKLADATSEQAKTVAQLRLQIQEQNKANKEAALESSGLLDAYQKESKRLTQLRTQYKALAAANKENTKEAKDLLEQVQKLDKKLKDIDKTVGQSQREVGNYEGAVKGLREEFGKLAEGVESANSKLEGLTGIVVLQTLIQSLKDFDFAGELFEKAISRVSIVLRTFALTINNIVSETASFEDLFENVTKGFSTFTDRVTDAIDKQDKNIESTRAFNRELTDLEVSLARVRKEQELAEAQAGDSTVSLDQQRKANLEALKLAEQASAIELRIARERQKQAQATFEAEKVAGEVSLATQQALSQARIQTVEAEKALLLEQQRSAQERRQILSDITELELDALIDGFDNQKSINERRINDEKERLADRRAILLQTEKDLQESVRRQVEVLNRQLAEINPDAAPINIDELLGISDPVALSKRLQTLGLSEILTTRQLEVIRDLRTATQDLAEANRDLAESEQEGLEISRDIEIQQQILLSLSDESADKTKALAELESLRQKQIIANLEERIKKEKEGSVEILRLRQQLNDALLEQAQQQAEKEAETRDKDKEDAEKTAKDKAEKQAQLTKAAFEAVNEAFQRQTERRLEVIDQQVERSRSTVDSLRQAAALGNLQAQQSVAEEERRQAELERQRQETIKRQQQAELVLTALSTYTAKVQAKDPNPLASTITDVTVLKQAILSLLPGFFQGTERVGADIDRFAPGHDGHIVRVDGGERIISSALNSALPAISNEELVRRASQDHTDTAIVVEVLHEVRNAILNKEIYLGRDFDETRKAVIESVRAGNKIERTHQRVRSGGLFNNR